MKVEFYKLTDEGDDVLVGTVSIVDGNLQIDGPDWLEALMREPVYVPEGPGKGSQQVMPEKLKEYLAGLQYQYRGAYLRASAPHE